MSVRLAVVLGAVVFALVAGSAHAAFPGTNGKIAFAVESNYRCSGVGNGLAAAVYSVIPGVVDKVVDFHHPLLRSAGDPDWAPHGNRIAAARELPIRGHSGTGYDDRGPFIARAGGGHQAAVTHHGFAPAWSPDATRLAYVTDLNGVWVARLDGTHRRRLDTHESLDVDWSPTGRIAYTRLSQIIYTIAPSGRRRRELAHGEEPDWSPDGKRLVFRDRHGRIVVVRADGSHRRVIRSATDGFSPVWSPDGAYVAFTRDGGSDNGDNVYVMTADGRAEHPVASVSAGPCGDQSTVTDLDWQPRP